MWNYRESRQRACFQGAQAAYDRQVEPLWDGPDPEPDDEPEEDGDE